MPGLLILIVVAELFCKRFIFLWMYCVSVFCALCVTSDRPLSQEIREYFLLNDAFCFLTTGLCLPFLGFANSNSNLFVPFQFHEVFEGTIFCTVNYLRGRNIYVWGFLFLRHRFDGRSCKIDWFARFGFDISSRATDTTDETHVMCHRQKWFATSHTNTCNWWPKIA